MEDMNDMIDRIVGYIRDERITLDPAVKQKWLDALRSGDFEQTKGWLNCNNGYCCLGVLAEINNIPKTVSRDDKTGNTFAEYKIEGKEYNCMLPDDAFGITWLAMSSLAELNDDVKLSFSEIADIIEEHL